MSPFRLLYRDPFLAAFDKPSGLLVHRGWGNDRVTAVDLASQALGQKPYPVHRLDRATSGVLVFALDSSVAARVQTLFDQGLIRKTYLALVRGIAPETGFIDHPIPRKENGPRVPAQTSFQRLYALDRYSLVLAQPHTGRLHQIRRHLKHISHPLIGDANYGKGDINRAVREKYGLARLALHALFMKLSHPVSGEPLTLRAPLAEDLVESFSALGIPRSAWESLSPLDTPPPFSSITTE